MVDSNELNDGATQPFGPVVGSTGVHGSETSQDPIAIPVSSYTWMKNNHWELIQTLLGGTNAMQRAGSKYTPRNTKEEDGDFAARVSRTFLYGAYADTVDQLSAKPFGKPVTTNDELELPEQLDGMYEDLDRCGLSLDEFARNLFTDGVNYGMFHFLVDYPKTEGIKTLKDQRDNNIRPTFTIISPAKLIGWRSEIDNTGCAKLTQIRIKEETSEPDGIYGTKAVSRIRVFNKTNPEEGLSVVEWELWELQTNETSDNKYVQVDMGVLIGVEEIPLVTGYFKQTGFMTAAPPLDDLASENLNHWQSTSEQKHILHFARVPILFGKGFANKEVKGGLEIGASAMLTSEAEGADLKFVEISGKAIDAGSDDLKRTEERMEVLGLQPLVRHSSASTATKAVISENNADAEIFQWIRSVEHAVRQGFKLAYAWVKVDFPDEFRISLYRDFSLILGNTSDMDQLQKLRDRGDISQRTMLHETKRRGILEEGLDIDEEVEASANEEANALEAFVKTTSTEDED